MQNNEGITIIGDFPSRLRKQISGLSPEQLTTAYKEDEWTIAQNVHHLFDAHTNAYQLCKRVLSEENTGLSWGQQDAVANLPDGQRANIEPSLKGLEGLHARWADMFSNVEDWEKSGTSLKSGKVYTIEKLLDLYVNHCENHIQQIQDVLDAMD